MPTRLHGPKNAAEKNLDFLFHVVHPFFFILLHCCAFCLGYKMFAAFYICILNGTMQGDKHTVRYSNIE